jgi:hypothetical protein
MRAREFLKELKLDIPDQMVNVQVPLSAIQGAVPVDTTGTNNPGKRLDSRGKVKWSPPLQQHLDVAKDSVGPSDQAVSVDPHSEEEDQQHSPHGVMSQPRTKHLTPVAVAQSNQMPPAAKRTAILSQRPGILG